MYRNTIGKGLVHMISRFKSMFFVLTGQCKQSDLDIPFFVVLYNVGLGCSYGSRWSGFMVGAEAYLSNLIVQEENLFKDISYLQLCQPFCLAEQNHLSNFGREHYGKHFCEIILNLDQCFRRCCLKKLLMDHHNK